MAKFADLHVLKMADFNSVCSLEHENLREQNLGYVLVIHKLKNTPRDVNSVYTIGARHALLHELGLCHVTL